MSLPKRLLDGYANFRKGRYASELERYLKLPGRQKPTIMMIACCDSRSAPETIFDAGPGEMFVVRNVANLVPPYTPDGGHHATSAALEFAVLSLAVEHIVVMGHGRCGGIRAAVGDAESPQPHGLHRQLDAADQGRGPHRSAERRRSLHERHDRARLHRAFHRQSSHLPRDSHEGNPQGTFAAWQLVRRQHGRTSCL